VVPAGPGTSVGPEEEGGEGLAFLFVIKLQFKDAGLAADLRLMCWLVTLSSVGCALLSFSLFNTKQNSLAHATSSAEHPYPHNNPRPYYSAAPSHSHALWVIQTVAISLLSLARRMANMQPTYSLFA